MHPCTHPLTHPKGGEHKVRPSTRDSLATPIVQTSTYTFGSTAELIAYQEGTLGSYEYGRYGSPTARAVELKLMELEVAEECCVSASGMRCAPRAPSSTSSIAYAILVAEALRHSPCLTRRASLEAPPPR